MKNSNTITEIMVGDHALVEVLFTTFGDNLDKNIERAENSFDEFRWELEKHIFVEEKVIFKLCEKESEICQITSDLIKEHDRMLEMLNKIKNDLMMRNKINTAEFQKLLTGHRETEEKILYPKLDEKLSKEEKEIMIARINEIPVGKEAGIV